MTETEPKADVTARRPKHPRHHRIPIRVSRDRHGRTGSAASCPTCCIDLRVDARFCDICGLPITPTNGAAEYKQVTVLFADVVGSMDIASALDTERLREIMTELFNRSAAVVQRYGGTVDKFTGDGIMALFGAPAALEDHAVRACLAALDIQEGMEYLATEVNRRDGIALRLRVGLNSGQVIAGGIGSSLVSYTAIGEQVGIAQRMESVAPPGGVMLSESTARLVEHATMLGEPEMVRVKGASVPLAARRLLTTVADHGRMGRPELTLVGRGWELSAVAGILDQSVSGAGCVVGVVGAPGIGKSRIARESAAIANSNGVEVFYTYCESHSSEIPFHAVAGLLRAVFGVSKVDDETARARVRARIPDADAEDLLLLDDLVGIRDPDAALPDIDPDARRRRLARLANAAALARCEPAVYIIEDAHWIDDVSESMLAEFMAVVPQTRSMVLITYRPEYQGALARAPGSQTFALAPLDASQTSALTAELLGSHPSVAALAAQIAERSAGNPFFAEEMVRDLAERGVLDGDRGAYRCQGDLADVSVPATVQATIAARIDRLNATSKRMLNAAAVIGSRFGADLLASVPGDSGGSGAAAVTELVEAELVDQVLFTPRAEYAFRHPLIRTVAYKSQLKSERAELHRRLAAAIEAGDPGSADENAALIATHLEAAGDLRAAFGWHMRAGGWSSLRDIGAARMSWQRARQVADRLPADDADRTSMRIAPRTLLCALAWRSGGSVADTGFDELRELATAAGDQPSLAIGMAGLLASLTFHAHYGESSRLASECASLIESIGEPTMTVGLLFGASYAKFQAGEMAEVWRLAQRVIELADGDPAMGSLIVGSPLALAIAARGAAQCCLGIPGWKDDFDQAIAMARGFDATTHVIAIWFKYGTIPNGTLPPDAVALQRTAEALRIAEQSGDDFTLALARLTRGLVLVHRDDSERGVGFELLTKAREMALQERFSMTAVPIVDTQIAREKARTGDLDGAVEIALAVIHDQLDNGEMISRGPATTVLVEALLRRGADGDLHDAQAAIDRLAAVPTEPGFVLHELPLLRLRALLASAHGDEVTYRDFVDRYRMMAASCGFEGHLAVANAMTWGASGVVDQSIAV
jgi:adenylate cyclase